MGAGQGPQAGGRRRVLRGGGRVLTASTALHSFAPCSSRSPLAARPAHPTCSAPPAPAPPQGYALMCVARPASDCVLETVPEGEAYMLQFGAPFEENALDPNAPSVERDDFAIELAMLDE